MFSVANMMPKDEQKPEPLHYSTAFNSVNVKRFGQLCKLVVIAALFVGFLLGLCTRASLTYILIPYNSIPLMVSSILVLLLRKQYLHVDSQLSPSLFIGFWKGLFGSFHNIYFVYLLSSWILFLSLRCTVWGISLRVPRFSVDLDPDLNEKHIYMLFLPYVMSLAYASTHVLTDYDLLRFPTEVGRSIVPSKQLSRRMYDILFLAGLYAFILTLVCPLLYWMVRPYLWSMSVQLTSLVFNINKLGYPQNSPFSLGILWKSFYSMFITFFLWEFANNAFSIYMTLGPVHRGRLISEKSPDPNGTLVTGLKHAKPYTKLAAFQELLFIALNEQSRRIAIFATDVSSPPSMWTQVKQECLQVIEQTCVSLGKPKPKAVEAKPEEQAQTNSPVTKLTLKHNVNIFGGPKPGTKPPTAPGQKLIGALQDTQGIQSERTLSFFHKLKAKLLEYIKEHGIFVDEILLSPVGYPLRHTVERKASEILPIPALVDRAVLALTTLIVASHDDDQFGQVQRDIPAVMEAADDLIRALEEFITNPPVSWTDVAVRKGYEQPRLARMREVLQAAESGFVNIVIKFGETLEHLSLSERVVKRIQLVIMDLVEEGEVEAEDEDEDMMMEISNVL